LSIILVDFFSRVTKTLKKIGKVGFESTKGTDLLDKLDKQTKRAVANAKEALGHLEPWMESMWEFVQEMLADFDKILEEQKSDLDRMFEKLTVKEAVNNIFSSLQDTMVNVLKASRQAVDAHLRIEQKIHDAKQKYGEEGIRPGTGKELFAVAEEQKGDIEQFFADLGEMVDPQHAIKMLGVFENSVDAYLKAMIAEAEAFYGPAIAFAKKAQEISEDVADQIREIQLGPEGGLTPKEKFEKIRGDIEEQRGLLLQGTNEEQLEAARKLQELNAELLDLGREELDTSGPLFANLRDEVVGNLTQIQDGQRHRRCKGRCVAALSVDQRDPRPVLGETRPSHPRHPH
jgi:hypothetical protein